MWILGVLLLSGLFFGGAVFGIPTLYAGWKHVECWLRGSDSYACWELDLLKNPVDRGQRRP
jgi:hypothetical protein